jgi:hypothetical protein
MDKPAQNAKADTDASDIGDEQHGCVKVVFKFVHGLILN